MKRSEINLVYSLHCSHVNWFGGALCLGFVGSRYFQHELQMFEPELLPAIKLTADVADTLSIASCCDEQRRCRRRNTWEQSHGRTSKPDTKMVTADVIVQIAAAISSFSSPSSTDSLLLLLLLLLLVLVLIPVQLLLHYCYC